MFSLLVWAIAEGFGGPYGSGSTDIGTSIIYALFFVGLLVLAYYAGTDRYSVDYHLEQKVSWWWRSLSSVGHSPAARLRPPWSPRRRQLLPRTVSRSSGQTSRSRHLSQPDLAHPEP